jgi:hypothetical protein
MRRQPPRIGGRARLARGDQKPLGRGGGARPERLVEVRAVGVLAAERAEAVASHPSVAVKRGNPYCHVTQDTRKW